MDYFTEEEIQQIQNEVSGGAIGDFKAVVDEETATFNANAENTLTGYNANAQEKFETYNANANSKFSDYNTNAEEKFSKYTSNAEAKLSEYNQNYTEKLAEYNQNAETKTAEFDSNATEKLKAYNDNHTEKMTAYDTNAEQHTTEYNDNHNLKLAKYNANASEKLTTYDANAEQHTTDYNRNAAEKLEAYNQNHAAKVAEYNANAEAKTAEFDSNAAALQTEVDRLRGECDTLAAENRKQENRIDALIKLNKGQTYDILPEEGETASRTAQSGAKYVSVDKVGGKSIVWNQLFNVHKTQTSYGMQIVSDGQTITMSGNSGNHAWMSFTPGIREFTALNARNHLYLYSIFVVENSSTEEIDFGLLNRNNSAAIIPANYTGKVNFVCTVTNPDAGSSIGFSRLQPNTDYNVRIVVSAYDLTLMFGAGNEPTAEQFERMFPADSYQYNPGEIISSRTETITAGAETITTGFPVLNSAGSVYDYIDLNEGKLHQRVGVVDFGTFNWDTYTYGEATVFRSYDYTGKKPSGSTHKANIMCAEYETVSADYIYESNKDKSICVHNGAVGLMINDSAYTDVTAFKTAMSGQMLYYELAEEIVTDIEIPTELTDWLEVEPGGTVTFRNADETKQLAVPNAVSWVRKLNEVE